MIVDMHATFNGLKLYGNHIIFAELPLSKKQLYMCVDTVYHEETSQKIKIEYCSSNTQFDKSTLQHLQSDIVIN